MKRPELNPALERLRAELARAKLSDPQDRQHIDALIRDIEHDGTRDDLQARIGEVVRRLEVEHPVLTGVLGQIAAALSAMGI